MGYSWRSLRHPYLVCQTTWSLLGQSSDTRDTWRSHAPSSGIHRTGGSCRIPEHCPLWPVGSDNWHGLVYREDNLWPHTTHAHTILYTTLHYTHTHKLAHCTLLEATHNIKCCDRRSLRMNHGPVTNCKRHKKMLISGMVSWSFETSSANTIKVTLLGCPVGSTLHHQ